MQQFFVLLLTIVLVGPATASADVLLSNSPVDPCGSSTILGDIDLMAPPQPETRYKRTSTLTFVPIETALPRLDVTPRAFQGIVAVELPGPGVADVPDTCAPSLLRSPDKPVAPQ